LTLRQIFSDVNFIAEKCCFHLHEYRVQKMLKMPKVILLLFVILYIFVLLKYKSMETSVLTIKGQLLIPKRLRNKYGIKPGIKIAFIESTEGVVLKPMDEHFFNQFVGLFKDEAPSPGEYKAWKKEEKTKEMKKLVRKPGKK
jgi:AbrB family looped-hinge helix DNA binding protein